MPRHLSSEVSRGEDEADDTAANEWKKNKRMAYTYSAEAALEENSAKANKVTGCKQMLPEAEGMVLSCLSFKLDQVEQNQKKIFGI